MDYSKAALVIFLTLVIVIGFNLVIYFSYSKRNDGGGGSVDMLRNAYKRARNPWEIEDSNLKELSERVAELEKEAHKNQEDTLN